MKGMSSQLVHTRIDGHVATLTLDRHEKRNCIDTAMCHAIEEGLDRAVAKGARAIVITGDGTAFSSGADLSGGVYADGFYQALLHMLGHIQRVEAVVIAAVNGPAIGAGTQLAMACDLRVVADEAQFRVPAVDVAIALDEVTVRSLERMVGGALARSMLLTSATVDAATAVETGFAVQRGGLTDALRLAQLCAVKAPLTVRHLKAEFAWDGYRPFTDEERRSAQEAAWTSDDVREAQKAREQKRLPDFHGR